MQIYYVIRLLLGYLFFFCQVYIILFLMGSQKEKEKNIHKLEVLWNNILWRGMRIQKKRCISKRNIAAVLVIFLCTVNIILIQDNFVQF